MRTYEDELLARLDGHLANADLATALRSADEALLAQTREDYQADVDALNAAAGWAGDERQRGDVPAKLYSGSGALPAGRFTVHVSFNNPLVTKSRHLDAHADVIRACLTNLEEKTAQSTREQLNVQSLFLVRLPTSSGSPKPPPASKVLPDVFCSAVNDRLRDFVFRAWTPARVLLDGDQNAGLLDRWCLDPWREYGVPKRPGPRARFSVGVNRLSIAGSAPVPLVRCGFLPSKSGPNSPEELGDVAQLLSGGPPDPRWPIAGEKHRR